MVPRSSVGRPRAGDVRKDRSDTALRAYIAGRLAGRADEAFLTNDLGVALNTTAVRRVAGPRHWRQPGYKPPGRPAKAAAAAAAEPPVMRDWLAVDAALVDLGVGLITVSMTTGRSQREAYRALKRLPGVVQVLAAGSGKDRRVVAVVLTDGEADRRRLRTQLDDLADDWRWDDVDSESVEPAVATWQRLAQLAADREGLRR